MRAGLKKIAEGLSECAITESACPRAVAPCVKMAKPDPKASWGTAKQNNEKRNNATYPIFFFTSEYPLYIKLKNTLFFPL
jgi:hypothetical protein